MEQEMDIEDEDYNPNKYVPLKPNRMRRVKIKVVELGEWIDCQHTDCETCDYKECSHRGGY